MRELRVAEAFTGIAEDYRYPSNNIEYVYVPSIYEMDTETAIRIILVIQANGFRCSNGYTFYQIERADKPRLSAKQLRKVLIDDLGMKLSTKIYISPWDEESHEYKMFIKDPATLRKLDEAFKEMDEFNKALGCRRLKSRGFC